MPFDEVYIKHGSKKVCASSEPLSRNEIEWIVRESEDGNLFVDGRSVRVKELRIDADSSDDEVVVTLVVA